jgi:hypothetical protein
MEVSQHYSNDLRYDHHIWENELNFYKNEISIFEDRLSDMIVRKPSKQLLRELEQFQNQFIRQKEVVDELNHKIHLYDDELRGIPAQIMLDKESREIAKHKVLGDDLQTNRRLYFDLRNRFNLYLMKYHI